MKARGRHAEAPPGVTVGFSNDFVWPFASEAEAIAYADAHGLQICVKSTPATIAGDLRGRTRPPLRATGGGMKYARDPLPYDSPEERWLRGARRLDLFQRPEPRPRWWPLRMFRRREVTP